MATGEAVLRAERGDWKLIIKPQLAIWPLEEHRITSFLSLAQNVERTAGLAASSSLTMISGPAEIIAWFATDTFATVACDAINMMMTGMYAEIVYDNSRPQARFIQPGRFSRGRRPHRLKRSAT